MGKSAYVFISRLTRGDTYDGIGPPKDGDVFPFIHFAGNLFACEASDIHEEGGKLGPQNTPHTPLPLTNYPSELRRGDNLNEGRKMEDGAAGPASSSSSPPETKQELPSPPLAVDGGNGGGGAPGGVVKITACDNCYRLHRKCDGQTPKCSLCRKTQIECLYSRKNVTTVPTGSKRKVKDEEKQTRALKKRVNELEGTVQTLLDEISQMRASMNRSEMMYASSAAGGSPISIDTPSPNNLSQHLPNVVPSQQQFAFALGVGKDSPSPNLDDILASAGVGVGANGEMSFTDQLFLSLGINGYEDIGLTAGGGVGTGLTSPFGVEGFVFQGAGAGNGGVPTSTAASSAHFSPMDSSLTTPPISTVGSSSSFPDFSAPFGTSSLPNTTLSSSTASSAPNSVDQNVDTALVSALDSSLNFGHIAAAQNNPLAALRNPLLPVVGSGFGMSRIMLTAWSMKNLGFTGMQPRVAPLEREGLINDFFEYMQRFPLPFVHETYIRDRLRNGIAPNPSLLFAMYAVASCLAPSADGSKWPFFGTQNQRSKQFCGAALSLLDLENPSLESCQALALVAMSLLKLDTDPDVLEARDPTRRKWSWLEKETRRRIFAGICAFDALDALYNETSFGLWKQRGQVKSISTFEVWQSIDIRTGEPTINPLTVPNADPSVCILSVLDILVKTNELCSSAGATPSNTISQNAISIDVDPMLDEQFNALDVELKTWLHVLPRELSLSFMENDTVFACGFDMRSRQYPFFGALRIHLYHYAAVLLLHRSRLLREFARMARSMESIPDGRLPELLPAGRESLRRCVDACASMIRILRREVVVISPSPLPSDRSHPVAAFCSPIEARAILECGLHSIVVIALLEGPTKMQSPPLGGAAGAGGAAPAGVNPQEWNRAKQRQKVVDAKITALITEYAGPNALADARYTLGVSARLLEQLAVRKPRVAVLSETLCRLIQQAGIGGLVKVDVLGNALGPDPFALEGLML
ncbi:hypothetical protein HDU97_004567 [Phlyctochytrium planicorne]|nr:hypothetical protein HDU97_004567 [Phlyctochytrium planicorne]